MDGGLGGRDEATLAAPHRDVTGSRDASSKAGAPKHLNRALPGVWHRHLSFLTFHLLPTLWAF